MPGSKRRVRAAVLLATLAVALLASPLAVSADGAISHSGKYGVHMLLDSPENPGATCTYNATGTLTKIRVRWPHVEGYDHPGGRYYRKVSWRFQVYLDTGSGPALHATTPLIFDYTYDNEAAYWPSQTYAFPGDTPDGGYSIHVQMYWYKVNGDVGGSAIHHVDYFRLVNAGSPTSTGSCPFEA